MLFLDEEIASRAPKRGRRRKAETQRLQGERRPKKQKVESITSSTRVEDDGIADIIVVGEGPATDLAPEPKLEPEFELEPESESDFDNDLGPASAVGPSTLKLRYNTIRLYSSAIINLYAQQKARGENPAPHPNGLAKKALTAYPARGRQSEPQGVGGPDTKYHQGRLLASEDPGTYGSGLAL